MSYLVLARKYRPQTFADLVGQEQVSRTLQNALATGRVAHAYLFSGPRGVGKTTAARLLAMSLSCLAENVADRPCGHCENCLEIQSGQAVDVIEVDGASNRGINEIRDLRETVKYLPAKSRYKVYIIDEVHALTKDAFNALLKTLEEPPPHVVFIFATTETHKVLPTILSRCQRYDFRRIRVEDIASRLAQVLELEHISAEPEALEIIARQAEGGLRDSLSLLDQAIAANAGGTITAEDVRRSLGLIDQALVRRAVLAALEGDAAAGLAALDEAYLRGYDFKDLGGKILEYSRGLALVRVDPKNARLMNVTETEEADFRAEAARHSLETLHRHFDAWLKFQRDLAYSPQPRWSLEAQVIRLAQLAPLMATTELLERLGRFLPAAQEAGAVPAPLPRAAQAASPVPAPAREGPAAPAAPSPSPPAEELEAAPSPADDQPFPATWADFWRRVGPELDETCRNLLRGAKAERWSAETVSLTLPPGNNLGRVTRGLLSTALRPRLQKIFGRQPELILTQPEDPGQNHGAALARLAEIRETPEVKALMEQVPGALIEFRPGAPASIPEDETETEPESDIPPIDGPDPEESDE